MSGIEQLDARIRDLELGRVEISKTQDNLSRSIHEMSVSVSKLSDKLDAITTRGPNWGVLIAGTGLFLSILGGYKIAILGPIERELDRSFALAESNRAILDERAAIIAADTSDLASLQDRVTRQGRALDRIYEALIEEK